ncbi:DNA-binding SARP family transcriptional activator [Catenuloplanes nepalensis]|uniref:DNA-binding SARP family transcriptional activator n=1 Tax=Catenuloplanes nepalensis TaxID=587533 RepID=A0ABT9MN15_9ACTN|nr:BTAD domain-containing putative transcriptional regulator [Catenuloplanes nepalensis]MDP9792824.1 DNA-binding SARP family transcriptional activator [Catenuloplanes nepalensis]
MTEALEFGVLGPLRMWPPGADATLTAPRLRGLLTLLLVEPEPVPVGQAGAAFGGTRTAGPVHVAIHRLRRWLGEHGGPRLELTPAGYRLDVPVEAVDAGRFRRLVADGRARRDTGTLIEALELWRGPVAADAPHGLRQRYAVRTLDRVRREVTTEVAVACLADGTAHRSLPVVERMAESAPLDELAQSLRALTLAACGLQAEALDVIARTTRLLADELGVDAGQHLAEARLRVLRQDYSQLPLISHMA